MKKKIAYVGVDYHLNSLSMAVMIDGQKKVYETIRIKCAKRSVQPAQTKEIMSAILAEILVISGFKYRGVEFVFAFAILIRLADLPFNTVQLFRQMNLAYGKIEI